MASNMMMGYMEQSQKATLMSGAWGKKYFILARVGEGIALSSYKTEAEGLKNPDKFKARINLNGETTVRRIARDRFTLTADDGAVLTVRTGTKDDSDQWVAALQAVLQSLYAGDVAVQAAAPEPAAASAAASAATTGAVGGAPPFKAGLSGVFGAVDADKPPPAPGSVLAATEYAADALDCFGGGEEDAPVEWSAGGGGDGGGGGDDDYDDEEEEGGGEGGDAVGNAKEYLDELDSGASWGEVMDMLDEDIADVNNPGCDAARGTAIKAFLKAQRPGAEAEHAEERTENAKHLARALADGEPCPVCYNAFADPIALSPCGHTFCKSCIAQAVLRKPSGAECPLCRTAICKADASRLGGAITALKAKAKAGAPAGGSSGGDGSSSSSGGGALAALRAKAAGPAAAAPAAPWMCSTCTMQNEPPAVVCAACETAKPAMRRDDL